MTPAQVKQQISLWGDDGEHSKVLHSGSTNIIGMTNKAVYRFPINKDALSIQLYEAEIYKKLHNDLNVAVPQLIKTYDQPACIVISRLSGSHLSIENLRNLSNDKLQSYVRQLIKFSLALNQKVDVKTIRQLENTCISANLHERSWQGYLSHFLQETQFNDNPWLEDFAHRQFDIWSAKISVSSLPAIVVHDDLHDANILFEDGAVSGVLDFGDTTVGTIAQELRQLYRISDGAVYMAIDEYELVTNIKIDFDEIAIWAVTQELASYCRWLSRGDLEHTSLIRAKANLEQWVDGFKG